MKVAVCPLVVCLAALGLAHGGLVPIDVHEESSWRDVLPIAIERARKDGAKLTMMTVVQHVEINMPGVPSPEKIYPQLRVAARERPRQTTSGWPRAK